MNVRAAVRFCRSKVETRHGGSHRNAVPDDDHNLERIFTMDAAPKSKRLFPSHTLDELYVAVKDPHISESRRDTLNHAIRQRDRMSQDYVPVFVVPQI